MQFISKQSLQFEHEAASLGLLVLPNQTVKLSEDDGWITETDLWKLAYEGGLITLIAPLEPRAAKVETKDEKPPKKS